MSFFASFRKPKISDPTLGALMLGRHGWFGEAPWLDGSRVLVSVGRDRTGPHEDDRILFTNLAHNYVSLIPKLSDALFTLWQPEMDQPDWQGRGAHTAESLWSMLELNSISLRANGSIELLYAFSGDFWPDAMFTVEMRDLEIRALSLDD